MSLSGPALLALHLAGMLVLPFLLAGLIQRVKALWAGRRGPPLWQPLYDVLRLVQKTPVYSEVTTPIFRLGPWVVLGTALVASALVPWLGRRSPVAFELDFVVFAYTLGLGRVFLMLGAMDTGSAFEGMGASREATFSAFAEPVFFLVAGTLAAATGHGSIAGLFDLSAGGAALIPVRVGCVVALFILLQVETARMPVDDPTTHLELTMVHEVMVLDHSGPDLAVLQYGAALKLTLYAGLIALVLNPLGAQAPLAAVAAANVGLMLAVAILVGTVESLVARLRLRVIPQYVLVGLVAAFMGLIFGVLGGGAA